ncbi:MAG: DUF2142 domain-containing protein [Microthrixaceae bacterium]|nr:DUF2142 domain-containing protein [Microthrixaceae bacterium]
MTDLVDDAGAAHPRRPFQRSPRVLVLLVGLWVFVLGGVWAVVTPPHGSPDEPAHTIRAVSLWSGGPLKGVSNGEDIIAFETKVPAFYAHSDGVMRCWVTQPNVTADCSTFPEEDSTIIPAISSAGLHPPAWYASIGWIGRLLPNHYGFYAMRLVAVLLCAAILMPLGATLRTKHNSPIELIAALCGLTPVAMFLIGSVNPNGYEIASAIAFWGSGLTAARYFAAGERVPRLVSWHALIAAATLIQTRPLSPGFAMMIAAAIGLAAAVSPRAMLRSRNAIIASGLFFASIVPAVVWALYSGHLALQINPEVERVETAFETVLGALGFYYQTAVGAFSWADAGVSSVTVLAWIVIMIAILGVAIATGSRRYLVVMALCVVAGHFLPAIAQYRSYEANGLVWQGRYSLPWLVGIPLLAAASVQRALPRETILRVVTVVSCSVVIGQVGGLYWAARRWTVGADNEWWIFDSLRWTPPGPFPLWSLMTGFAVAAAAGLWVVSQASLDEFPVPTTSPRTPDLDPPVESHDEEPLNA